MAFEYLKGWRLHNLPGQPLPVFDHPHNNEVFLDVQMEPPLVLLLGITEKSFLALSLQVFIDMDKAFPVLSRQM